MADMQCHVLNPSQLAEICPIEVDSEVASMGCPVTDDVSDCHGGCHDVLNHDDAVDELTIQSLQVSNRHAVDVIPILAHDPRDRQKARPGGSESDCENPTRLGEREFESI